LFEYPGQVNFSPMKTSIRELLPKDKSDVDTAARLMSYSYEEVKPIIPELLTWIQDMNWPVAGPVASYLKTIAHHITPDIIRILRGNDSTWKYWCLQVFGYAEDIDPLLLDEIKKLREYASQRDIEEGVLDKADKIITPPMDRDSQNGFHFLAGGSEIHFNIEEVFFSQRNSVFGGYDTRANIEIKSGNFNCSGEVYISTGQLNEFYVQLNKCYQTLVGSARLSNEYESNLELVLRFDGLGHVNVRGFYKSSSIEFNQLEFEFETDQTYIFQLIEQLRNIVSQYGHN